MTNHLRLDLDLVELLAGVNANNATNHLGDDDHVSEVSLNKVGLLVGPSLLLGLSELLDETHGSSLQTTVDPAAGTSVDDISELVGAEVQEAVEATVSANHSQVRGPLHHPSRQFNSIHRRVGSARAVSRQKNVLVKVDSSVGELSERSLLLELSGLLGVLYHHRSASVFSRESWWRESVCRRG